MKRLIPALILLALAAPAHAQGLPALQLQGADGEVTYSLTLQILALMTVLTVLPSIVMGMSAFTRIIIVLSILRQALGTQQTPPNQVLVAIALFLSFFVMQPVLTELHDTSLGPYLDEQISAQDALEQGRKIVTGYMLGNTRQNDLMMFSELAKVGPFENNDDVPLSVLLPAYMTSELKTAFQIGFLIFLPFLVIDMVIASILMALGMMMLSPMLVSLPFKLLLFVLVDGWALMMGSLASSFLGN
ncbi:flagellar type III secretion system pore protein FliP [Donghicola sp. C2-DW-16]|uniref:Flagellar biosynthetic protein FliP n=1 Tax=Donghicola mangrovi TaxID=2729614 RepID=A0A850Q5Z0_9RHOB|nr:flagellar type III secretion system pore protein FliP [Donghicola mangrovi]NVO22080.1 flagellar type III secretion system pore protein FliP [Donghicola mangrovi]NVO26329.1 flagellar type III secretion system pore protein FliP [Donghicola mangrovi]